MSDGTGLELLLKRIDKEEKSSVFIDWVLSHDIILKKRQFSFTGFEELKDIYMDMHPRKVIRKGVQIGVTTWAILYKLWKMFIGRLKGIYYAPSKDFFKKFTPDRVDTILKYFPEISLSINGIYLKECGGSIYFCGLNTRTDVASVDADTLIFDEFDISNQILAEEAKDRLMRSTCPELHMLSKPSLPGFGIDQEFKESDQHFRLMKCPKCNKWNDVIEHFPKNLFPLKKGKGGYLGCMKCKAELDPAKAKWVPKKPKNKEKRGYHLSQLYWTWKPPGFRSSGDQAYQLIQGAEDIDDTKRVHQSVAGLAFAGKLEPITDQVLNECHGVHGLIPFASHSYLGFDQGDWIYIVIGHMVGDKLVVLWYEKTMKWKRLDELMTLFNVWCAVGDALPNKGKAKDWAVKHKGFAYIQYFAESAKSSVVRGDEYYDEDMSEEQKVLTVSVNRDESLDKTTGVFQNQKTLLPKKSCEGMPEFRDHLKNLKKERKEKANGTMVESYVGKVDNHYGMAYNSMRIASKLPVVKPFGLPLYAAGSSFYAH
ncbi:MAG: phage terminase large subunit family protein [Candidatus Aminicenantes bacterium]|jgi:hypothetical protein